MGIYILKRLLAAIPILFVVTLLSFFIIHMVPGDPALAMLGRQATASEIENVRKELGLDRPVYEQYGVWLSKTLQGDLGRSITNKHPVADSIKERLPETAVLASLALLVSLLIAFPAGIVAAARQNTILDRGVMFFSLLGVSVPSFWAGLILMLVFATHLRWFPASGYISVFDDFWQGLRYMVLPSLSLGFILAGGNARMMRSSMLEVLRQDYMRTARAKGLSERASVLGHGLRNALIPVVTMIGMDIGWLMAGTVVVETVYGIPGIGRLVIYAVSNRDYPVIQGVILYIAVVYMLANLIVDVAVAYLDPSIRYE
jgi:peptide/nickel transport system permease protein